MPNQQAQTRATISKTLISIMLSLLMICAFMPHEAQAANTTTANTPTGDTIESWTFDYKEYLDSEYPSASEPVVSGNYVYIAADNKIIMLNKEDGKVVKEADLATNIGYTTRAVVTNGLFVVPLNDGRIQANKLETLDAAWTTETIESGAQNCSTLTVDGTNIYFGTVSVDFTAGTYTDGYLTCINATNGALVWQNLDEDEGYYWDGGTVAGNYFVISGCAGTVKVFNKSTGEVQSTLSLGAKVNSDVVFKEDGTTGYVVTRDGKLHVLSLNATTGALTSTQSNDLGLTGSACTPTISDGKLYVGGEVNNSEGSALAIVDLTNYETQLIKTADGNALLGGGIKGAPLVSTNSNGTYVYFTVNNAVTTDYTTYTAGGGVFSYKVGDEEAKSIYDATGHHQYCDSPVINDTDGNLYYINDSCTLFKLQQATAQMNRLYNKWTGEHFYTASTEEKEGLVKLGWTDEGIGWTAPTKSKAPVYRLYNGYVDGGDHHYTLSADERDACVKAGWTYEGIGWYSDDDQGVEVYRQYNPFATTGTHNYTTNKDENDNLVKEGWQAEGISWYGVKES